MVKNGSITVYHYNGKRWERSCFDGVSVYFNDGALISKGITAEASLTVRIWTNEDINIAHGDKVLIGCYTAQEPPKGNDTHVVSGILDNRRGSYKMRHWRLICK